MPVKARMFNLFYGGINITRIIMDIERKIQFSNILMAHQLGWITFDEAKKRILILHNNNYIGIKPVHLN